MIQPQYIPPPQLPDYPAWCAESAAALLRDLSENTARLKAITLADAKAMKRSLQDCEYLANHVRKCLE